MPITFECSKCQKSYRVQDEHAGKKFRCKNCDSVIQVPFEEAEILEEAEDEWGDDRWSTPAQSAAPPAKRKSRSRKRGKSNGRRRSGSSDSMPIPLMIVIGLFGLLILGNIPETIMEFGQNVPKAIGRCVATFIQVVLLVGLIRRNNAARWGIIILSAIPLILGGLSLMGIIAFWNKINPDLALELFISLIFVIGATTTCIVLLCLPSVGEYFDQ